jgi:hypothetical protein
MKTKREATAAAHKLRARMSEPLTWKARVWENAGWHCMLYRGTLQVYKSDGQTLFSCLLGSNPEEVPPIGGAVFWSDRGCYYTDPNKAVEHQLKTARKFQKQIARVLELADPKREKK